MGDKYSAGSEAERIEIKCIQTESIEAGNIAVQTIEAENIENLEAEILKC
jgi:ribosomal protein L27